MYYRIFYLYLFMLLNIKMPLLIHETKKYGTVLNFSSKAIKKGFQFLRVMPKN